jgi:hypothetical protein
MRAATLTDETTAPDTDPRPEESQPDYVFEGFEVEFSERIALMPPRSGPGDRSERPDRRD